MRRLRHGQEPLGEDVSAYVQRYGLSNREMVDRWIAALARVFAPSLKAYTYDSRSYRGATVRLSFRAIEWESPSALDRRTWESLQALALSAGDSSIALVELAARRLFTHTFDWTNPLTYSLSRRLNFVYPTGTSWQEFRGDGTGAALDHPLTRQFVEDGLGRCFIIGELGRWGLLFDGAEGMGTLQLGFEPSLDQVVREHFETATLKPVAERLIKDTQLPVWARD